MRQNVSAISVCQTVYEYNVICRQFNGRSGNCACTKCTVRAELLCVIRLWFWRYCLGMFDIVNGCEQLATTKDYPSIRTLCISVVTV